MQVSEVYIYFTFLDIKGDRSLLMLVETWQDVSLGWLKRLNAFRPICSLTKTWLRNHEELNLSMRME